MARFAFWPFWLVFVLYMVDIALYLTAILCGWDVVEWLMPQ
jgi:hypothetical protein